MKTARMLTLALALAVVSSWTLCAWAADTPATAPETKAPVAKAKITSQIKCVVTGKLEEKKTTNKQGREIKMLQILVASAKSPEGKDLPDLVGKRLRVAAKKGLKVAEFVGKEVTISGTALNYKRLQADSIK